MDIRNIINQKKENKRLKILYTVAFIIIVCGIIILINNIIKYQHKNTYKVGQIINISGTILKDNNYPKNTHILKNQKESFGIKSSSINLNYLTNNNVLVNGEIIEISKKYPILDINNIKDKNSRLIINNNRYFFTNYLISLDFSQDTKIRAQKNSNYIRIYYEDEPMLSIKPFICNKVTPNQDCENLIYKYTTNLNNIFTTFLGYTFYKQNNNSRITFNGNKLGYIFTTENEDFLLDISHLINIIDSNFILNNKKNIIDNNCQINSGETFNKINNISLNIIDEKLTKINIKGDTKHTKNIECKLTINILDNRKVKNISIK